MTLKPMYPAAVNSPGTELAADITATTTEITVLSTVGLPPAPNLLTLGSDETAETVRYTKIDGTKITVERGFQGVAKSWSAGTRVARYFTAYDHDTFRANIEAIDAETSDADRKDLTLSPGLQIVESAQETPFQFDGARGITRINLNGFDGNFDRRTSPLFTFFGTSEIVPSNGPIGTKCQKVVCNRTDTAHFGARYELNIDRSKHYVAVAYLENVSCDTPVYFSLAEWKSTGYYTIRKSGNVAKGSGLKYRYIDISPTHLSTEEKLIFYFRGEGTAGAEFRIGAFGIYEITQAEYEAIGGTNYDYVAEKYPYVDSMTNVTNPYAIVTGGNLLPPFTEWETEPNAMAKAVSPYEAIAEITSDGTKAPLRTIIPVLPNTVYTVSSEGNAIPANGLQIIERKDGKVGQASGEISGGYFDNVPGKVAVGTVTFTTTAQTHYLSIRLRFDTVGIYTIKKPLLVPGTDPKSFTPQQRSMLAFETELAAHPVDGSNPDTLFMGDDGLPYVLEPWKKVTLDGTLDWRYPSNPKIGFKEVFVPSIVAGAVKTSGYVTKYDGSQLTYLPAGTQTNAKDQFILNSDDAFVITISNTDSGWGQDYVPTPEEIKAYFLGWRMYDTSTTAYNEPYNRTDGAYKGWVRRNDAGNPVDATGNVPTTQAPINAAWQPYRLQYLKAKPTVEPVRNYELGATLSAGSNMVEVGSGIVIREKTNPYGNYINAINAPGGRLQHRTTRLLAVYRNQTRDFGWTFKDGVWNGEPYQYAENPIPEVDTVYHVTYRMLDPTLAAPISGTVAANMRGTVSDLVQDVGDIGRRLSVVETQKAEAVEDTGWIPVTPINGWTTFPAIPLRFRVIGNRLLLRGAIQDGTTSSPTQLFTLPINVRSAYSAYFGAVTWGAGTVATSNFLLQSGGTVSLNSGTAGKYISFDGIEFLIDGLAVKKS